MLNLFQFTIVIEYLYAPVQLIWAKHDLLDSLLTYLL